MLKESCHLGSSVFFYFACRYIRRKSREEFKDTASKSAKDLESIQSDLEVVKRQAVVYSLYARREIKSIMDMPDTTR